MKFYLSEKRKKKKKSQGPTRFRSIIVDKAYEKNNNNQNDHDRPVYGHWMELKMFKFRRRTKSYHALLHLNPSTRYDCGGIHGKYRPYPVGPTSKKNLRLRCIWIQSSSGPLQKHLSSVIFGPWRSWTKVSGARWGFRMRKFGWKNAYFCQKKKKFKLQEKTKLLRSIVRNLKRIIKCGKSQEYKTFNRIYFGSLKKIRWFGGPTSVKECNEVCVCVVGGPGHLQTIVFFYHLCKHENLSMLQHGCTNYN